MVLVGNAHLITGNESAIEPLLVFLESQGHSVRGSPDVYVRTYASFGIDDAIELRDRSKSKALTETQRMFICAMPGMTSEAQNALLKTLEEPAAEALFFLILPAPETLLPTIRSRMQRLNIEHAAGAGVIDARKFLAARPALRLEMIKPLLEKGDDPSTGLGLGKRDIGAIITFLSSLERVMADDARKWHSGIEAVLRARAYASDKGSLIKPLLEQVALLA